MKLILQLLPLKNPNNTIRISRFYKIISGIVIFGCLLYTSYGQKLDVAYVPTPDSVVERMLDMANVGPGDYVIDLGCGDGRINIAAAKRGALGHGVDLDPEILKTARINAEKHGVDDSVFFIEENIYSTDFSKASVIAMYLFPDINLKLRPKFLKTLKPGTRIVSHDFGMDEWKPDKQSGRMENHAVLLWIVPAQVAGTWHWKTKDINFSMKLTQKFQQIEPEIFANNRILKVIHSSLSGEKINITVEDTLNQNKFIFSGQAKGNKISGFVKINENTEENQIKWEAYLIK